MDVQGLWQQIYERFDPERPAYDPAERADRPRSPAAKIVNTLNAPFADARFLLTGTIGTGKTTELYRVAEQRRGKELNASTHCSGWRGSNLPVCCSSSRVPEG